MRCGVALLPRAVRRQAAAAGRADAGRSRALAEAGAGRVLTHRGGCGGRGRERERASIGANCLTQIQDEI